jgi:nicotinate phosphoribosyltransferase
MAIIQSLLDNDLYKFSMQKAVLELYPDAMAEYRFTNRGKQKLGEKVIERLREELTNLSMVRLLHSEIQFLKSLRFFKPQYIAYLSRYRFNPNQISLSLDSNQSLSVTIKGPWRETILWEVPLMALISEIYFEMNHDDLSEAGTKASAKGARLDEHSLRPISFADFGTRRRRSQTVHNQVVDALHVYRNFVGTSNVHLAKEFSLKPIGTMAHEWVMGVSALEGLRHANRFALHKWKDVYKADLGIALTDTFGTDAFWGDFDLELAKVYDGLRHDSGDPLIFGEQAIKHYQSLGIDPKSKTVVFSDGLNINKVLEIERVFENRIKTSYGIGTHLTNDFETPALNMVIKLRSVDGIEVIKLSDEPGKETGDTKALEIAHWMFGK